MAGWTIATAIGWVAGLALGMSIAFLAPFLPWASEDGVIGSAVLISLGLTIGVAQWLGMRPYLPQGGRWVAATLAGYLLCLLISIGINLARLGGTGLWQNAIFLGLLGIAAGGSQWWILRQRYRRAGLWVLAAGIGFQGFLWLVLNPAHSLGELFLRSTVTVALAAALSGGTLAWLVHQTSLTLSEGTA